MNVRRYLFSGNSQEPEKFDMFDGTVEGKRIHMLEFWIVVIAYELSRYLFDFFPYPFVTASIYITSKLLNNFVNKNKIQFSLDPCRKVF